MKWSGGAKKILRLGVFVLLAWISSISTIWSALQSQAVTEQVHPQERYSHHSQPAPDIWPGDKTFRIEPQESLRLQVTGARLECAEDDCTQHQRHCALEIDYRLSSEFGSNLDVDARVSCDACLDYTTWHGYRLKSNRCSTPSRHRLTRSSRIDGMIVVNFRFSPYEQVVDAEVRSIRCRIEEVDARRADAPGRLPSTALINE